MDWQITRAQKVEMAKLLLKKIFSDELISGSGVRPKNVYSALAEHKLGKSVIKEARRQLGIVSVNIDGEQFWFKPGEGWLE